MVLETLEEAFAAQAVPVPAIQISLISNVQHVYRDIISPPQLVQVSPTFLFLSSFSHFFLSSKKEKKSTHETNKMKLKACNCSSGSTGTSCSSSGVCTCKTGFTGNQCNQCASGYYGASCAGNFIFSIQISQKEKRKEPKAKKLNFVFQPAIVELDRFPVLVIPLEIARVTQDLLTISAQFVPLTGIEVDPTAMV